MGVMRLGYVHARVNDLPESLEHYHHTLGMQVAAEEAGRAYLKAWEEFDHHSVVLA